MEAVEEQEEDEERHEPKLKIFKETIQCIEDVLCFLDNRGCTMEANQASKLLDSVNLLCVRSKNRSGFLLHVTKSRLHHCLITSLRDLYLLL